MTSPGRCVVIVVACSAFGIIPCCQEMPGRPFDGVSEARTEFVRDVSDGSRPVCRRLLFLLVSYRPLAIGRIVIAARVVAAECSTAHAEEPQRSTTATKNVQRIGGAPLVSRSRQHRQVTQG